MKKKIFKRASAVMTAALMTAAITATSALTAGAVAIGNTGAVQIDNNDTTLTIPKGISLINVTPDNYYSPEVTYTYTIAPATVNNVTITDTTNHSLPVENGPTGGVTLGNGGNVEFASELSPFSSNDGTEKQENLTVNVDTTKFTKPGIFRYVITDTTADSELYNAGIVRPAGYDTTRYLDVYIQNNNSGFKVTGYTLRTENDAGSKSQGFVTASETSAKTDKYRTYNIKLEKTVKGDMGDKNHEFPFTVTLDNNKSNNNGNDFNYKWGKDANNLIDSSTTALTTVNLKHNDTLYIRGLSPKATVGYTETNDTPDTYKAKIDGKTSESENLTSLVAESSVEKNGTKVLTVGAVTNYDTANPNQGNTGYLPPVTLASVTNYREVMFTNTLEAVSPTGLVLRFAPFIAMAVFGVVFLVIAHRKKSKDNTDVI